MKVYKFGGTSVGTPQRMGEVARIINDNQSKIVVLSAMSGTTNALVDISSLCYRRENAEARQKTDALFSHYTKVIDTLFTSEKEKDNALGVVSGFFSEIKNCITDDFSPQDEKKILSYGELISTHLFHFYLRENGIKSTLLPALDFMRTDRMGEPDMYYIAKNLNTLLSEHIDETLFITQGYICLNNYGEVDNLCRGGSDYTATIIGASIGASEVQIWTDIDGLHNNDPRVVDGTSPVARLSYSEAEELAYFGAKILHPLCIIPAHNAGVPVWLKNTMNPASDWTLICSDGGSGGVKAIAARDGNIAIKIQSARMIMAYGFLRRIFEIFERYRTPIDMITTSEVAVSLTIDDVTNLSHIVDELREFGTVSVDKDMTIVSVVGHEIASDERSMDIFAALKGHQVRMISYGGSSNNISILIPSESKKAVLGSLSSHLFK
ncbi:MAG: aspartate kinase [Flavobacteriales bacterium]|nr:aspartate kinase [Flavobacteriales bacterium]